nr:hypothetical protein [Tanacetum cinerariifolium]
MMLLARAITQHYLTLTSNCLCTSSNTRNQAIIQDGRVDIQRKNIGYAGNGSRNARRVNMNQETNVENGFVQKNGENEENVQRNPRTASTPGIINMLLAAKDEAEVNLDTKENDFMLMNAYGDDQLEEINALVIMMVRIQPSDNKSDAEPTYDAEVISKINASQIDLINGLLSKGDHEHRNHEKFKTIKHTSANDKINSDIIFDDLHVEDNNGQAKHDPNAHNQTYIDIESHIYNVQVEAENQFKMNNELKKKNVLIQRELEIKRLHAHDAYGDDQLEEINALVIMMARIQPTDNKSDAEPTYDAEVISKVNASQIDLINGLLSKGDHENINHEKFKTIKHTSADDKIDSDIIFDDLHVEDNNGQAEHDQNAHNQT